MIATSKRRSSSTKMRSGWSVHWSMLKFVMILFLSEWWAEPKPRPVDALVLFLRGYAECNAAVERHCFKLNVEALAIGVGPCSANSREEAFLAFAVADLVGDMAGCFAA